MSLRRSSSIEGKRPLRWMLGLLLAATLSMSAVNLWLIWHEALGALERQVVAAQMMLSVHTRVAVQNQEALLKVLGENAIALYNLKEETNNLVTGEARIHGFALLDGNGAVLIRTKAWEHNWDQEAMRLAKRAQGEGGGLVFGAPQSVQGGGTILPVALVLDDVATGGVKVAVAGWNADNLLGQLRFHTISRTINFWLFIKADDHYFMLTETRIRVPDPDEISRWAGKIETAPGTPTGMNMAASSTGSKREHVPGAEHGAMSGGDMAHGGVSARWANDWPAPEEGHGHHERSAGVVQQLKPWAISIGASVPESEAWVQFRRDAPMAIGWGLLMLIASLAAYRIIYRSQIEHERRLIEQASLDPLTGLANRTLVWNRLEQELARLSRTGKSLAAIMIDLDNFKALNDARGHEAGDELLRVVARTLTGTARKYDLVSRQGGDEFLVVCSGLDDGNGAHVMAERIMEALRNAMERATKGYKITVSVGVAIATSDASEPEDLLRKADRAMYEAKARGKNIYQFYDEELNRKIQRRLAIERGLENALERGELWLALQPQWDARTGQCIGFEALARWNSQELGEVSPAEFIPVAEESTLINNIGAFALREAMSACLSLSEAAGHPLRASINVSAKQFNEEHLEMLVASLLTEYGVDASDLMLEVTESVMASNMELAIKKLSVFREMGAGISVDDFGTGYSSLSYLHRLPATEIKIDQSFVRDMMVSQGAFDLTLAISGLGRSLGLVIVAEGVETEEQAKLLRGMGVEILQGYLYGKPMPIGELASILRENRKAMLKAEGDGTVNA